MKAEKKELEILTVERLRNHLIAGPQVPFWNYDPSQLTIGVEIEYFIAHSCQTGNFTLVTKEEYHRVIGILKNNYGYVDHNLHDQPGRVSKDTETGFIAIKPDFAWHILEISLPPRKTTAELRHLLTQVFFELDSALAAVCLVRLDISSLPEIPSKIDLVELDRLSEVNRTLINSEINPTAIACFPALITATHIHLNVFREDALAYLKHLYHIDQFVSEKFTRPSLFRGRHYKDLRSELYRGAFGKDYHLCARPSKIPGSLIDICDLMNRSRKVFPSDKFFPVRDMSYIRPSRYGTFEFRSSCSFKDVEKIIEIANYRVAQVFLAFFDRLILVGISVEILEIIDNLREAVNGRST